MRTLGVTACAVLLSACASIVEGHRSTDHREHQSPGSALQAESKKRAVGVIKSEIEAMTASNIIFGGIIGLAVDAGSGAINVYPPTILITLPSKE